MNSLSAANLCKWADQLLSLGVAPKSVVTAAVHPDLPPEKIQPQLMEICDDLEIDPTCGFEQLKEEAYIQEYLSGLYTAPHIIFACNRFRIRTKFPEQLTAKFVYDDGLESVTYHGLESGITGDELATICLNHMAKHGVERSPKIRRITN